MIRRLSQRRVEVGEATAPHARDRSHRQRWRVHVMLPDRPMSDVTAAYDLLARGWTHEGPAGRYRDAKRRGA